MHDAAELVTADRARARDGLLTRVVSVVGLGGAGTGDAAVTSPAGRVGRLLGGAATAEGDVLPRGVSTVAVSEDAAVRAGLSCGGTATLLVQPLTDVPDLVWEVLAAREAVCLVTDLDGPRTGRTTWFTLESLATGHDTEVGGGPARHTSAVVAVFGRGVSGTAVQRLADGTEVLVHALWPVPRLAVLGAGPVADALAPLGGALGWSVVVLTDPDQAAGVVSRYTPGDAAVACTHGANSTGTSRFLRAALARRVGYVAALGPRRSRDAVVVDLAATGVPLAVADRVRGPAGLDLGAHGPAEVALSILAEAVALRGSATARPLTELTRPVSGDRAAPHE